MASALHAEKQCLISIEQVNHHAYSIHTTDAWPTRPRPCASPFHRLRLRHPIQAARAVQGARCAAAVVQHHESCEYGAGAFVPLARRGRGVGARPPLARACEHARDGKLRVGISCELDLPSKFFPFFSVTCMHTSTFQPSRALATHRPVHTHTTTPPHTGSWPAEPGQHLLHEQRAAVPHTHSPAGRGGAERPRAVPALQQQ